ncbi:MAG: hypothetical protein NZ583_00745 [Desulfobacterota bacterium]|nr:hypothetical protein [Thermodesulfobacteriota bacterium]MDW8001242.1 hypothetical protein [Deltaproteobacteria bacterium]
MRKKGFILVLSLLIVIVSCGKKGPPVPKIEAERYLITDLKGEVKDGALLLSFSVPKGLIIEGFKVIRKETINGKRGSEKEKYIRMGSKGSYGFYKNRIYFFDSDLTQGSTYTYTVFVYGEGGLNAGHSNPFFIKWRVPPEPVEDLRIEVEDGVVNISWKKEEGYLYNIYRYEKGTYSVFPINEKPIDLPWYRDSSLEKEGVYVYEVRKVKREGDLLWEGEGKGVEVDIRKKVIPPPPYNVIAQKEDDGISIFWEAKRNGNVKSFRIYRFSEGKREVIGEVSVEETRFKDYNFPFGTYVIYAIKSIGHKGEESEDSNMAIVYLEED